MTCGSGRKLWLIGIALASLVGADASSERTASEIQECAAGSRPDGNTVETIELVSRDRVGRPQIRRAIVYSGRTSEGLRALYLRLLSPSELRGSEFLVVGRGGEVQMFLSLAAAPGFKRIEAAGRTGSLFGTDFSAEDLRRLYGLNRPGESTRLADAESGGRATWVIRTVPADDDSTYGSIESHVDQLTCVVLVSRLHQEGGVRKELRASADAVERVADGWIARELVMRDLRDATQTRLAVESVEAGDRVLDLPFRITDLP